jgi:hypothetical protein
MVDTLWRIRVMIDEMQTTKNWEELMKGWDKLSPEVQFAIADQCHSRYDSNDYRDDHTGNELEEMYNQYGDLAEVATEVWHRLDERVPGPGWGPGDPVEDVVYPTDAESKILEDWKPNTLEDSSVLLSLIQERLNEQQAS